MRSLLKKGCAIACSTVRRFAGTKTRSCERSEIASGSALGNFFLKSTRRLNPIERTYLKNEKK